jgi:hypothetical protein
VQDDLRAAGALPHGHLHCAHDHVAILPVMHGPADYQLAEQVEHDAQIELALRRQDLGNVGDPLGLRFVGAEIALEQVRDSRRSNAWLAAEAALAPSWPALQARAGHQACDPVEADALTFVGEILMHAWRADHALAVFSWISRMRSSKRTFSRALAPGTRHAHA